MLLLLMLVVQFALWAHATHIAQAAANSGVQTARAYGSTADAGATEATTVLDQLAGTVLTGTHVEARRDAATATVTVTGDAVSRRARPAPARPRERHRAPRTRPGRPVSDPPPTRARGSVSAELAVFVVPVLVLLTMFIVFCGRTASAAIDVHAAPPRRRPGRSRHHHPDRGGAGRRHAVAATTAGTAWTCTPPSIPARLRLGGQVSVAVDCRVPLSDLGLPGLGVPASCGPAQPQPIDRYRADP